MKNFGKAAIAVIIMVVIAMIVNIAIAQFTMDYYTNPVYFDVWSDIMMPDEGPPPVNFYLFSAIFQLITAIFFVFIYYLAASVIPAKKTGRGLIYGIFVFLIGRIPCLLTLILLINLPVALILWWALADLIIVLLAGLFTSFLVKPKYGFDLGKEQKAEIRKV